ncbi:winged helix-turn-helix domain-containing protein [Enterococcus sp. AZ072]|uniref:winged helix-turn-helix domain-containing protein n=1 Tax=unclassified Enterococcus TaxID=2608891 RepID=UPI003D276F6C
MQHVLILTKNVLSEEPLIQQLHYLNYEVLCSADLIQSLQQGRISPVISYFHLVIISETVSNSEAEQLLPTLSLYALAVIRVGESLPTSEQAAWQEQGIHHWITKSPTIQELREGLVEAIRLLEDQRVSANQILNFPISEVTTEAAGVLRKVHKSFSKTEKKVFDRLLWAQSHGGVLSRKELCEYLWEDGQTSSNMSQLSCLINKIKVKFEQTDMTHEIITTLWGRGYKLNEDFYQRWLNEEQEAALLSPQSVI